MQQCNGVAATWHWIRRVYHAVCVYCRSCWISYVTRPLIVCQKKNFRTIFEICALPSPSWESKLSSKVYRSFLLLRCIVNTKSCYCLKIYHFYVFHTRFSTKMWNKFSKWFCHLSTISKHLSIDHMIYKLIWIIIKYI